MAPIYVEADRLYRGDENRDGTFKNVAKLIPEGKEEVPFGRTQIYIYPDSNGSAPNPISKDNTVIVINPGNRQKESACCLIGCEQTMIQEGDSVNLGGITVTVTPRASVS